MKNLAIQWASMLWHNAKFEPTRCPLAAFHPKTWGEAMKLGWQKAKAEMSAIAQTVATVTTTIVKNAAKRVTQWVARATPNDAPEQQERFRISCTAADVFACRGKKRHPNKVAGLRSACNKTIFHNLRKEYKP